MPMRCAASRIDRPSCSRRRLNIPPSLFGGWDCGAEKVITSSTGGANLRGADLWRADLQGADLGGANLPGADVLEANLQGADLGGANLQGADLQGASLDGADFQSTWIVRANLKGVDLFGATRLSDLRREHEAAARTD